VAMLYHPSHHVPDLDEAEEFFERVFGRPSTRLSSTARREPPPGWSNDYATFTPIADVLFDSIDPRRYLVAGRRLYDPVDEPRLRGLGWYLDDVAGTYAALRASGLTVLDQMGEVADADEPPNAAGAPMPLFFTSPHDAGLRHELLPRIPFPLDHRQAEGWSPGIVDTGDPLGIVRCGHHTIRTADVDRALLVLVGVLGGEVVEEATDDLLGAAATFVRIADTTVELVADRSPGPGSDDDYFSIAFEVVDLDRAVAHLAATGVELAARSAHAVLTDPTTSLGVSWRFVQQGGAR
jgi:catechol 2,3-dioxygenase-like lactoylglutathione lyase family enzyme